MPLFNPMGRGQHKAVRGLSALLRLDTVRVVVLLFADIGFGANSLDKRYQVFISSTFLDLKEERQAVSQALLRSDCFPAQMENWPAMDAEQMEAIKQIIDESDYYVVISAGKYGSISPETGLSYTEMEYDYAVETGKPIIRLLHKDPFGTLKGSQIESKAGARKKLEAFHEKLKAGKVCSFWENADQLKNEAILGLLDIKKRKVAMGWVRADGLASKDVELEMERMRADLSEARRSLDNANRGNGDIDNIHFTAQRIRIAFSRLLKSPMADSTLDRFIFRVIGAFDGQPTDDVEISKYINSLPKELRRSASQIKRYDVLNLLIVLDCISLEETSPKFTAFGERIDSFFRVNHLLDS